MRTLLLIAALGAASFTPAPVSGPTLDAGSTLTFDQIDTGCLDEYEGDVEDCPTTPAERTAYNARSDAWHNTTSNEVDDTSTELVYDTDSSGNLSLFVNAGGDIYGDTLPLHSVTVQLGSTCAECTLDANTCFVGLFTSADYEVVYTYESGTPGINYDVYVDVDWINGSTWQAKMPRTVTSAPAGTWITQSCRWDGAASDVLRARVYRTKLKGNDEIGVQNTDEECEGTEVAQFIIDTTQTLKLRMN